MKKFLILIFVLKAINLPAQKIFSDTKDPFTNIRTVSTSPEPLYKSGFTSILQVSTSLTISGDTVKSYILNFITPSSFIDIQKFDSTETTNICQLKDENGKIYTGKVNAFATTPVLGKIYTVYSCGFSEKIFEDLLESKLTDIKITINNNVGGIYPVDKKRQKNIAKQIQILFKSLSTEK